MSLISRTQSASAFCVDAINAVHAVRFVMHHWQAEAGLKRCRCELLLPNAGLHHSIGVV
jgi:hypothetical protein